MKEIIGAIVAWAVALLFVVGMIYTIASSIEYSEKRDIKDYRDLAWSMEQVFGGDHSLYSIGNFADTRTQSESRSSGSFFVLLGGYSSSSSSSTTTEQKVRFSWKTRDGSYVISELPIKRVRFVPITDSTPPYCTFSYNVVNHEYINGSGFREWYGPDNNRDLMNWVGYVVLHVPENNIIKPMTLNLN